MEEAHEQLFSTSTSSKEYSEASTKDKSTELESKIAADREQWTAKLKELVSRTRDVRNLTECQIDMLSWRQMLVDGIVKFKLNVYKRKAHWDKLFKTKYRSYTIDYDLKLTKDEKISFIDADMSALKFQIRLIESHVDFYTETIKTLDNLAFAIRNRIRLSEQDF